MKLRTVKEVAQELDVSPVTVIRLADSGALDAVEVHKGERRRLLRFRPEAVEKFIASRETQNSREEVA